MRIGYDAKRFFHNQSGLGNYSRDLIRILSKFHPQNEYFLYDKKASSLGGDILLEPSVHYRKTTPGILSRQLNLGKVVQLDECDIFHGLSGELPLMWGKKDIQKILTVHDLIFLRYPHYYSLADRKIHYWKLKKSIEIADTIIAISEQTRADLERYFPHSSSKVQVIYQGYGKEFQIEHTAEELNFVKNKYRLPEQFFLNVGTVEPRKNAFEIVKAVEGTGIPLIIVGRTTPYCEKIKTYIEEKGLGNQVQILHQVSTEELARIYAIATAFIYPSHFEGFGIPIIEAIASNLPVITNKEGVFREVAGDGALYIDVNNGQEMREAMKTLFFNSNLSNQLVKQGRLHIEKFSESAIASQWNALYCNDLVKL